MSNSHIVSTFSEIRRQTYRMETANEQVPVEASPVVQDSKSIKTIKREQKKDGVDSFLVVFEGDANDKGQWVPEAQLPAEAVKTFREQKKSKKSSSGDSKVRKIKEIKGIIPKGDEMFFVVRFRDATKDEAIPKATMHSTYVKDLLKFYESNIERIPVGQIGTAAVASAAPPAPESTTA